MLGLAAQQTVPLSLEGDWEVAVHDMTRLLTIFNAPETIEPYRHLYFYG